MIQEDPVEQKIEDLLSKMTLREKVALLSGRDTWLTVPISRLGIGSLVMTDGPHGVRANREEPDRKSGFTTAFPTGSALAATWDVDLVECLGQALAEETLGMGCDILLGPCVNILRNPLGGRNFETYAEDPYLAGRMGVAWVRGLQSRHVGASLKHFAANNQEIERFRSSSEVDERTLREIYLPAFETVVKEAQPWTVMCSYNRLNGVYASQNKYLLREILKEEWGFDGFVVSDWGANHTTVESVEGGLDLEMPGPAKYYGDLLVQAVYNWQIDPARIDDSARRILRILARTGKLDGQQRSYPTAAVNTPEHQQLARQAAEEAIILLKNENGLLPLDANKIQTLAVIGPNAAELCITGGGSSATVPTYQVSPLQGLKSRLDGKIELVYEQGCDHFATPPVIPPEWFHLPESEQAGLRVEYFNNSELAGQPGAVRTGLGLDFWAFSSRPAPEITYPGYSARWTGKLCVPATGTYHFELKNSSRCRVYLDGQLLLENVAPNNEKFENSWVQAAAEVELEAGRDYDFRAEYVQYADQNFSHAQLKAMRVFQPGEDERLERAVELAHSADAALVFVGMPPNFETEGDDRPDLKLPGGQDELVRAVAQANPNTVVILNAGSPVEMPWLDQVPAVVDMLFPGLEGGNAIARVLLGEVNPSGKLTASFPRRLEDNPAYTNPAYPEVRQIHYGEGIFVGYRYYDYKDVQPLFPFGHGLSYTTFEYQNLQAPKEFHKGELVHVSVEVKNNGPVAGKEVIQLYVRDVEASLPRPPKELKGFAKLELQPGETKTVSFTLDERSFAFYDPLQKAWIVEPGEFEILVGSSSRDICLQSKIKR